MMPAPAIGLGVELFHEQLRAGPGDVVGIVLSLVALAAGVFSLSSWAPPVMTADERVRLSHASAGRTPVS